LTSTTYFIPILLIVKCCLISVSIIFKNRWHRCEQIVVHCPQSSKPLDQTMLMSICTDSNMTVFIWRTSFIVLSVGVCD